MDETLQAVNHQSVHLKADLRVSQQEKEYLKQEAAMLQKKLQNVNNKVKCIYKQTNTKGDNLRALTFLKSLFLLSLKATTLS